MINQITQAAQTLSEILLELEKIVWIGNTPMQVETAARHLMDQRGVLPYNLGYHPKFARTPYPYIMCIGRNDDIAHTIPNNIPFQDGDIVYLDTAIMQDGVCADAALTIPVGNVDNKKQKLLKYARQISDYAASLIQVGETNYDIADKIDTYAVQHGYTVNRVFAGHEIGETMHGQTKIYNGIFQDQLNEYKLAQIEEGRVYCVEPMITTGRDNYGRSDSNGWNAKTRDGQPSAFFEQMVLATKDGAKIITNHV